MEGMSRVLFLFSKNSARSQMAEAFLNSLGEGHFEAYSAGLEPDEVDPLAKQVMSELGYDISAQSAKGVREYLGKVFFRYLIIACGPGEPDCPKIWPGISERFLWPVEDPTVHEGVEEDKVAKFREARDQIRRLTQAWVAEMTNPNRGRGTEGELFAG